jgi:hypothetical protein
VERDFYPTPAWVTEALAEHVDLAGMHVWECACGTGKMSEALKATGASVYSSDIEDRGYSGLDAVLDFIDGPHPDIRFNAVITNPPFGKPHSILAERFIETGLRRISDFGFMALLLPKDFDAGKTRPRFFADCAHYAGQIILTRRILWYENPDPKRENPKENSVWHLWSRNAIRGRSPVVLYAPSNNGAVL